MSNSSLYLKQVEVGLMKNFSYLVGDTESKECVLIDPAWEVDRMLQLAEEDGMKITSGLITHTHFDHCNNVDELVRLTGSKIYIHRKEADTFRGLQSKLVMTEEGTEIKVGNIAIYCLHTPGHSPGSQCFLVDGRLFTGDTLFINACGRCDLPGGSGEDLYLSLKLLARLSDETQIFPGHHYADEVFSTMGREKKTNPYYQCPTLQDFLRRRMGL